MTARIVDGVVYSPLPDFNVENYSAPRLIRERLSKFGEKILAIDHDQQLTGNQLLTKIKRYGMGFQRHGLGPGSHVCICVSNTMENLAALLGVVFVGGTIVVADPALLISELLCQVKDSECMYVVTDEYGATKFLKVQEEHRFEELFCVGDLPGFTNICQFQDLPQSSFEEHSPVENAEDVIALVYTTGTTGPPKGIEVSHKSYVSCFHSLDSLKLMAEDDVILAWRPMSNASGFTFNLFSMCMGAMAIFRELSLPFQDFLKDLETHKVTTLSGFPTKLQEIVNEAKAMGARIPRIKLIFMGGRRVHRSFGKEMSEVFGVSTLANMYATTEAFEPVCATPLGQVTTDNVGLPVAGCIVKIVNPESGKTMPSFERGEIWTKCSGLMKGYYGRPEATAAAITADGWLRTGDLGYHDDEGRLYIVDRLKELIKCMGNLVAPAELEEILMSHDAVKEVAVVGLPCKRYGEAPTACVALRDAYREEHCVVEKELKQLIADQTAVHEHLYGGVFFMDCLPNSNTGKILKQELKSAVAKRQATISSQ